MLKGLKQMLGFAPASAKRKPDPITAQVTIATQRNERAAEKARELLQGITRDDNHMAQTVRTIVGKMK